jgi:hypothetical protein
LSETDIAVTCVRYFLLEDFDIGAVGLYIEERLERYQLSGYIGRYWGTRGYPEESHDFQLALFQLFESPGNFDSMLEFDYRCSDRRRNIYFTRGQTQLHVAAKHGLAVICGLILKESMSTSTPKTADTTYDLIATADQYAQTTLHYAAIYGHPIVVELLLNVEVELASLKDTNGRTAFHCAALAGHAEVAKLLLEQDKNLAVIQDDQEQTPLHCATYVGQLATVALLLETKSNRTRNKFGHIPLHDAVINGHADVMSCTVLKGFEFKDNERYNLNCSVLTEFISASLAWTFGH